MPANIFEPTANGYAGRVRLFGIDEAIALVAIEPGDALLRTEGLSRWQGRMIERALTWWAAERVTLTLPHLDQADPVT